MDKLRYERELSGQGFKYVCGVDEVGRGPLAGPVVCAAVIMPLDDVVEGIRIQAFQAANRPQRRISPKAFADIL